MPANLQENPLMPANPRSTAATPRIVPVSHEHRDDWEKLYAGYAAFYRVDQTPEMRATVWGVAPRPVA